MITVVLVLAFWALLATKSFWQLAVGVYVSLIDEYKRVHIEAYLVRQGEALRDICVITSRVALWVVYESRHCEKCEQKSIHQALNRIENHVVFDLIPRTDFLEPQGKSVT